MLFLMASIELSETVYIARLISSLFCTFLSGVGLEVSLGSTFLPVMSVNFAAKPTFLFDPSV